MFGAPDPSTAPFACSTLAYLIWPQYGGSIMLLTLIVMLVLTPLTLKGTRSMMRMQQLQPEMKKLQTSTRTIARSSTKR